ncbi:MAG: putative Ig domain-containing protein [Bacteroidaceae bacterium]|nr:putative Ig domain-containing protein [Bacteroidaceae bacterium]
MKKRIFSLLVLAGTMTLASFAQEVKLESAKFHAGDDMSWAGVSIDESSWRNISNTMTWTSQGVKIENGFGWYRYHVTIPKSMLEKSDLKESVDFNLGKIDDADEAYLNGKLIGKTGRFPSDEKGYGSAWSTERLYRVKADSPLIKWDADNVIAVRVYNGGDPGGMFAGPVKVRVPNTIDNLSIGITEGRDKLGASQCVSTLTSKMQATKSGVFKVQVQDPETGKVLSEKSMKVSVNEKKNRVVQLPYDNHQMVRIVASFVEDKTGLSVEAKYIPKYILTPAAPAEPRFNTAPLYGVRPGSPIHFRFGVSGDRPMKITSDDLPAGLAINPDNGALSGSLEKPGSYTFTVKAKNAKGEQTQRFTIRCGSKIALTPPMGWNSWNCWGLSVTQDKVISSAKALIEKGLADYGYCYMNIDDGWEAPKRNADGTIAVNEKFPSMKDLGDWLHSEGLKFGIYSSPGDLTCGGYLGSIDHELQDAESYNSWGIDYLKYDWCGYGRKHRTEPDNQTVASYVRPYLLMERCLRQQPRDIFYSLCQYGMADVWKWGEAVDANSWRTTGDITDTWESLYDIGFDKQPELYPYAKPGHWNDPDMLIVGKVGWSNNLRDSRLTPDEQYTHISLWSLLASNMLIGCDIAQIDDFTIGVLCNNEVNAVNQDILGKQAQRVVLDGAVQIWMRPLSDGAYAVGIFNVGTTDVRVDFKKYFGQMGIGSLKSARDLWRQKDLSTADVNYFIPTHGVKFLKIRF